MGKDRESGSKQKQIIGYEYSVGMHLISCHGPVSSLLQINIGDYTAWVGTILFSENEQGKQIKIDKPNLFAGPADIEGFDLGDEWESPDPIENPWRRPANRAEPTNWAQSEGGVEGYVDVEWGSQSQGQNDYLVEQLGAENTSAHRGVLGFVLRRPYIGNSPYVKSWSFLVSNFELTDDWQENIKEIHAVTRTVKEPIISFGEYPAIFKVLIEPEAVRDAGAQWRVYKYNMKSVLVDYSYDPNTGTYNATRKWVLDPQDPLSDWMDHDEKVELEENTQVILVFKDIEGWNKPDKQDFVLKRGRYSVEGTYTPISE